MLKVIAQDFIRPEFVEIVRPLYAELVETTRQEPLCLSYDLFVDQNDPGHFVFIELWPIARRSISTARPSISRGWCR
ncbi:antibiotic biosynthesis monooxygenase [Aminobacter sp. Y103A]|uniref:putative quinol monooxygenase n=1 Tax=Aminobacter sp. Y103A TaxID=1870862 RepID=UPI002573570C|nr:putative quinol monooxygenase [Aminobacter sp. SS-2016]BBD38402.1 antibiotic biosynthesis monooxygenase [Aminobacter sp. SS-2016]